MRESKPSKDHFLFSNLLPRLSIRFHDYDKLVSCREAIILADVPAGLGRETGIPLSTANRTQLGSSA